MEKNRIFGLAAILSLAVLMGCGGEDGKIAESPLVDDENGFVEYQLGDKAVSKTPCAPNAVPVASFALASESVDVLYHYGNETEHLILTKWGVNEECRWIRINPINEPDFIGSNFSILSGTTVLYGLETKISRENDETIVVKEYTSSDELVVSNKNVSEDEHLEEYWTNGQFQFSYSCLPNEEDKVPTEEEIEASESLALLAPTLYNNPEGDRLLQLIGDQGFLNWYAGEFGAPSIEDDDKALTFGVGGVALFKCLAGGFANPLCAVAVVVDAGLWFVEAMVCHVIPFFGGPDDGCDNLPGWW